MNGEAGCRAFWTWKVEGLREFGVHVFTQCFSEKPR